MTKSYSLGDVYVA